MYIIMKTRLLLAGALLLLGICVLFSQEKQPLQWRKAENNAFKVNEKFEFTVTFGMADLGTASMEVKEISELAGRKTYHLIQTLNSNSFFDKIYKIRTWDESWMDTESLCSLRYIKHYREGPDSEDKQTVFDQENRKFRYTVTNMITGNVSRDEKGDIPAFINDALSSLYFIRTLPLEKGRDFIFDTQSDEKIYSFKIKVLRKETVKVSAGKFTCNVVEPTLYKGDTVASKGTLLIWMSDDSSKTIVMMKSKINIGFITIKLKQATK